MDIRRILGRLAPALVAVAVLAACDRATSPIVLDQMMIVSGDAQVARPGQQLAEPLVVRVNDPNGNGVRGVRVAWKVDINNGTVSSPVTTTNGRGEAEVRWTLGTVEGVNGVSAEVAEPGIDGLEASFGATGITSPP